MLSPIWMPSTPAMATRSPATHAFRFVALETAEGVELGDARGRELAIQFADAHVGTAANRAVEDAANRDAAQKLAVIQVHHLNLQYAFGVAGRRRNGLDDGFEERQQILRGVAGFAMRHAVARVGVDDRKIELVFGRVQIDEQVVDFVEDFGGPRVGTVDLVQDDHRRQLGGERFLQDVAGLWERAFARIDQHHYAVDHAQRALHFAAEVAVTRRVDDVDLRVVEEQRGVLGENGDAALALQIVGVHYALDEFLVGAEDSALAQHGVDQRGLAVVDVRDDGDVANILAHWRCRWVEVARLVCLIKTKIAAETTSSPYGSPRILRCGRAIYSLPEAANCGQ